MTANPASTEVAKTAAPAAVYRWRGRTRSGELKHGPALTPAALADMAGERFDRGWRSLTVTLNGHTVAAIGRQGGRDGRRTWWAETPQACGPLTSTGIRNPGRIMAELTGQGGGSNG